LKESGTEIPRSFDTVNDAVAYFEKFGADPAGA
jgi:hypothetical protein